MVGRIVHPTYTTAMTTEVDRRKLEGRSGMSDGDGDRKLSVLRTFRQHRNPIVVALLAAILSMLLLIAAGTPPGYPVNDSGAYHRMVALWSESGAPVFIGWNEMTLLGHLAVGVMADSVGAGSIRALQLLVGLAGALIVALIAAIPARRGLAGASAVLLGLCWIANPVVLVSATGFMTEVPESLWAVLWLVACASWLRRGGAGMAFIWVCAAVLAFSVRQTAVVLPVAAALAGFAFQKRVSTGLLAGATLAIDGFLWWYRASLPLANVRPISDHWKASDLPELVSRTGAHQVEALVTIGLLLLPLVICMVVNRGRSAVTRVGAAVAGAAAICLLVTRAVFPFWRNIMAPTGLLTDTLPPHDSLPEFLPVWVGLVATVLGVMALAVLASIDWRERFMQEPAILLSLLALAAYVTLASAPAQPFDRYLVPALAFATLAVVSAQEKAALKWKPATILILVVCAGSSAFGVQRLHARQRAVWKVASAVVDAGVSPQKVDAGIEWNMAHQPVPFRPENARFDRPNLSWYEAYPFTELEPTRRLWIGEPPVNWEAVEVHTLPSGHDVLVLAPVAEEPESSPD